MEKSAYTAAPTITPTTWGNRVRGGTPVREELPPQPRDLKLRNANQAKGFFATFPRKLKETFEYARDHPGQFALSAVTSMMTYVVLRGAIAMALGFTPCLAASVALAMITSATISVGKQLIDHLYGPPPDANDLGEAHQITFRGVMSKAMERGLWSGAIAGLVGVWVGDWMHNFKLDVKPMDGDWATYDPAVNGPHGSGFIDAHGHLPPSPLAYDGKSSYVWPVDPETSKTIFDNCGERLGRVAPHNGMDISTPVGTPVRAAASGIVTEAGWDTTGGYGYYVDIKHLDAQGHPLLDSQGHPINTYSRYAHLSGYSVNKGDFVDQNQFIARSGNTGSSLGPHLHFELRDTDLQYQYTNAKGELVTIDRPYNPLQYLPKLEGLRPNGRSYVVVGEHLGQRLFDIFTPQRSR